MTDRPWTVDQTADYLQVSPSTVYRWRAAGRGPRSVTVGAVVRYRPQDVYDWLENIAHGRTTGERRIGRPRSA